MKKTILIAIVSSVFVLGCSSSPSYDKAPEPPKNSQFEGGASGSADTSGGAPAPTSQGKSDGQAASEGG